MLSGLKRGAVLSNPGALNLTGAPPSGAVATTQISLIRAFLASTTDVTCTATYFPSGLIAGAVTVLSLYQSAGSNARFAPVAAGVAAACGAAACGAADGVCALPQGASAVAMRMATATTVARRDEGRTSFMVSCSVIRLPAG